MLAVALQCRRWGSGKALKEEFPRIHRPTAQSLEIPRMLRYRHRMVKMRTMIVNNLQALAIRSGLSLQSRLLTRPGRLRLLATQMSPVMSRQREEWLSLVRHSERAHSIG